MAEGGASLSTEVRGSAKAPEAKKLQKKRVSKREVKGFYYHAAEYQRQKQNERKSLVNKMFHGMIAPFSIHVQAWRLRHFASKYGGRMQGWVLDNEFARKALDKKLTDKDIREFKAKTQMHTVFEKYHVTKADEAMAKSVLQDIFNKKGELSKEDIQRLQQESGMEEADIMRLATTAKENAGNGYLTVDEMKGKFTDDAIFGGLTEEQKKIARKICRSSWASTGLAAGKIAVLTAMGINPLFLGTGIAGLIAATGVNLGLSGGLRIASLLKEGNVYAMNKQRGVDHQQHINWLNRLMGVDWDKDHKGIQIARAALVGTGIGLIFKFHPQIMDGLGDLWQHGIPDHVPHIGVIPVHHDVAKTALEGQIGPKTFHEHLSGYEQPVKISYLPDTAHHDWQQLHTFVQHQKLPDGHTVNELKLSYNGVDDGIAHNNHYIDLMMPDGKQVFLQNDAVLAASGPDADKLIKIFGLVHEHGHTSFEQIGEVHSINLAHQLGLNQGRIDNFAHLTQEAHSRLWHGTQDASDLQTILHNRGLYNNGGNGNYLYGVRIGGGYYDSMHHVFKIGASNHYFNHSLLTNNLAREYHAVPQPITLPEEQPEFHSAIAGPLQWFDDVEDRMLAFFDGRVFSNSFTHHLDQVTDFGLKNTDYDASAIPRLWAERPWYIGGVLLPYAAAGYAGYLYGKNRAGKKLTLPRAGLNTALETALFLALPGTAVTATIGYWIGKMRGKKKEKAPKPAKSETNPETKPANSGGPSDTNGAVSSAAPASQQTSPAASAQSATPVPPPTSPLPSTVAGGDDTNLPPAPPPPATTASEPTPENLPVTTPIGEEEPVAPPAPNVPETAQAANRITTPPPPAESPETVAATIPLDTDTLDVSRVAAAVADPQSTLKDIEPFNHLANGAPDAEKEKQFREGLLAVGAAGVLTGLLVPVMERLQINIPKEELEKHITTILERGGEAERVTSFILLADRLRRLAQNPEELRSMLEKVTFAVGQHAGEGKEAIEGAVKTALADSGEAGEAVAALGEEALPVLEEVAPLLAA